MYFELTTDEHPDVIEQIKTELASGVNPRGIKYHLAQIITSLYWGESEMRKACTYYDTAFRNKEIPTNIPELLIDIDRETIEHIIPQLITMKFVSSKSEFLRLIKQDGVQIDQEKIAIDDLQRVLICGEVMRIGKKRFVRFIK